MMQLESHLLLKCLKHACVVSANLVNFSPCTSKLQLQWLLFVFVSASFLFAF